MREQNKALTLRTRQRLEMSQKLTQEYKARIVRTSEEDEGHHKGMLRKHAKVNIYNMSPQKSTLYMAFSFPLTTFFPFDLIRKGVDVCNKNTVNMERLQSEKSIQKYGYFLPFSCFFNPLIFC
jgi:hypothetical protein